MTYSPLDPRRERGRVVPLPNLSQTDMARLAHYKQVYALESRLGIEGPEADQLAERLLFLKWCYERETEARP